MRQRSLGLVGAIVLAVGAFGLGIHVGADSAIHPTVLTGDGYVGADVASFQVGDTVYGFRSAVNWTDSAGSFHDQTWPACLPKLREVSGVRFVAQTVWVAGVGINDVVWVDCQGR